MRCAVFGCNSDNGAKSLPDNTHFYRFPKDTVLEKIWIIACCREDKFKIQNARICSKHFEQEDYQRNLKYELLNYLPKGGKKLKPSATPSLFLPKAKQPSQMKPERKQRVVKRYSAKLAKDIIKSRFPKDTVLQKIWVIACCRVDKFNVQTAKICSKHFEEEDYERNLRYELLNYLPKRGKKLKPSATPSLFLPKGKRLSQTKSKRNQRAVKRNSYKLAKDIIKSRKSSSFTKPQPEDTASIINQQEMSLENAEFNEESLFICAKQIDMYKCQKCSKFQTNFLIFLKDHIQEVHRNDNAQETSENMIWLPCEEWADRPKENSQNMASQSEPEVCKNNEWFECEQCYLKFKTKDILERHIKIGHPEPEEIQWFHCPMCTYKFRDVTNLKQHLRFRHCEAKTRQRVDSGPCTSEIKEEIRKATSLTQVNSRRRKFKDKDWFNCSRCSSKYRYEVNLKKHITYHHYKSEDIDWIYCVECSMTYLDQGIEASFERHRTHCRVKYKGVEWLTCEYCPSKFAVKRDLKQHVQLCHPKLKGGVSIKCQQCNCKFDSKTSLQRHIDEEHPQCFQCPLCTYKFRDQKNLKNHITYRH